MLDKSSGTGHAPLTERGDDLYETPAVAVRALLAHEKLPPVIWEPACGRGAIAHVLQASGHTVYASDLRDYKFGLAGLDFLSAETAPPSCGAIVTNPPYKDAQAFVERALELAPLVVMLLRLAFLESERRSGILDDGRLARVWVFRNRLPMLHRDGWTGNRASNSVAFAWFVWERDRWPAPAEVSRISWRIDSTAESGAKCKRPRGRCRGRVARRWWLVESPDRGP